MEKLIWHTTPPKEWMEGLPIGNGRLAAMVWGDAQSDVVSLNHEWLWRGVNRQRDNQKSAHMLPEVRRLLRENDFFRATMLTNTYFAGLGGASGIANRVDAYQPAGDLTFRFKQIEKYLKRELDIENAVAGASRMTGHGEVNSFFIAHPKVNHIICRWEGDVSGVLSYSRVFDENADESLSCFENGMEYTCKFKGGISYSVKVKLATDGKVKARQRMLEITDGTELTAFVNIHVNEIEKEEIPLCNKAQWSTLLTTHKDIFSAVLGKFSLEIEGDANALPTDQRIDGLREGKKDPLLLLLYFNFGRYLLVSSSICGELPANLQGKWNDLIKPPWNCDYHFDINLQMNYWMAESVNLSECVNALVSYVESFMEHGKKAARDLYGCRGIVLPLLTDAWGRSTPESFGWAAWIGAAPWIAQHFWWHYSYTGDAGFLSEHAYPFFKEIARFYEDYLEKDENGVYQIMPSQSPENRFNGTGGYVSIGISAAMDVQLAFDALRYAIRSAELLGIDKEDRKIWTEILENLPAFKIGSDGRLLEWDRAFSEEEAGHRHLSHLYGLYPSDIFNPVDRPKEYAAAIHSLTYRLENGGGHTGWSRAWVACMFARLGNGKLFWEHFTALIKDFATVSMLDLHPPRIFQIDGNLGAVAAAVEAIAQFWAGKLYLLRAVPEEWKSGSLTGLKTPGGHSVSMKWQDGLLTEIEVVLGWGGALVAVINGEEKTFKGKKGDIKNERY